MTKRSRWCLLLISAWYLACQTGEKSALRESFNLDKLVGFIGIWIGLAIFSYSLLTSKESPQTTAN